jgi:hypothetical protein
MTNQKYASFTKAPKTPSIPDINSISPVYGIQEILYSSFAATDINVLTYLVAKDLVVKFAEPVDTDEERAEMIQSAIRYAKEFVSELKENNK